MYTLKLIKGKSYTGAVRATEKKPLVELENKAEAEALVATGYFALISEDTPDPLPDIDVELEKMTIAQLQEFAKLNDIDLGGATRKDDILTAIENAGSTVDPADQFVGNGGGENSADPPK